MVIRLLNGGRVRLQVLARLGAELRAHLVKCFAADEYACRVRLLGHGRPGDSDVGAPRVGVTEGAKNKAQCM